MLKPKDIFKKALEIIKLDRGVIKEVGEDKTAFLPAIGIVLIGGLLAGIGSIFTGFFAGIIIMPIAYLIGSFIGTGIIYGIAYLLGGRGSFLSLYKVFAYASILGWFSIIPFIGWIPSLWILVVMIAALQVVLAMSKGKAIGLIVILIAIWLLIAAILTFMGFMGVILFKEAEKYTSEKLEKQYPDASTNEEGVSKEIGEKIAEKILEKSDIEVKIGKLPKDFPEDIPIYKDATVSASVTVGTVKSLQLTTSATLDKVTEYYKAELKKKGWKVGTTIEQAEEDISILVCTKDERQIQVQMSGDEVGTSIMIMY